jgi:WD40 repeat protein
MSESNLAFVANRFLNSGQDVASLLELYRKVWKGQRVLDDETSLLVSVLKLSGIVRSEEGRLRVRNRIYARIFDRGWIREHMPDTERRRQRAAYLRGLRRAGLAGGLALLVVGSLALYAHYQAQVAHSALLEKIVALHDMEAAHYEADMFTAYREWMLGNPGPTATIVEKYRPQPSDRNSPFLWRYFWGLLHPEEATLRGHTGLVFSVDFSPDGRLLASASFDGTVKIWDVAARKEIQKLPPYKHWATCVAFSPDRKMLATCGGHDTEGWVQIWDVVDRNRIRLIRTLPQEHIVYALAFSPDGRTLATGYNYGNVGKEMVRIWDVSTWHRRAQFQEYIGPGRTLAFSPDGRTLATGNGIIGEVTLWDAATGRQLRSFPAAHHIPIYCVAFSPDGRTLASGSGDGTVILWDVASGRPRRQPVGHGAAVQSVAFSSDGRTLASGSWDYTVKFWDVASGREIRTFRGHEDRVNAVAFSPDGKTLATGSNDKTVRLWDARQPDRSVLKPSSGEYRSAALAPDNRTVALSLPNGTVQLWDADRWKQTGMLKMKGRSLAALAFSPVGRTLAISVEDRELWLWDLAAGRRRLRLLLPVRPLHEPIAFSPDGRTLAVGYVQNGQFLVCLWDVTTGHMVRQPLQFAARIFALDFSEDSRTLALALDDAQNRIVLWDVVAWRARKTLMAVNGDPNTGHTNSIEQLAFSPDGRTLASGSFDSSIILWDVATGTCLTKIAAHRGSVNRLAFSPGGKTLATGGGDDHLVKLWDVERRRTVAVFTDHTPGTDHTDGITYIAFSRDGRLLVTGDPKTVRFWRAPSFADIQARERDERR